jgi:F-type H+-transporting ATPase subunit delta
MGRLRRKDSSFLKKRSKKLLQISAGREVNLPARVVPERDKSFLVLFFKKEHSFLSFSATGLPPFGVLPRQNPHASALAPGETGTLSPCRKVRAVASGGSTLSRGGGLADRYAAALYSLAEDERTLDETVDQMSALGRLIDESRDLRRLLESPLFDVAQGVAAIRAALQDQGFSPLVVRFACVVASNRRLNKLRAVVAAFAALVAERRGVVTAHVSSAHPLTTVQREALRARLIEAGYGQVNIDEQVDRALLGGLVVRIGARLFDSSIKSRLQRLQYAMKGAA